VGVDVCTQWLNALNLPTYRTHSNVHSVRHKLRTEESRSLLLHALHYICMHTFLYDVFHILGNIYGALKLSHSWQGAD